MLTILWGLERLMKRPLAFVWFLSKCIFKKMGRNNNKQRGLTLINKFPRYRYALLLPHYINSKNPTIIFVCSFTASINSIFSPFFSCKRAFHSRSLLHQQFTAIHTGLHVFHLLFGLFLLFSFRIDLGCHRRNLSTKRMDILLAKEWYFRTIIFMYIYRWI